MSWYERAACRGMDSEIFFAPPDTGDGILALATCAGCPVADLCLDLAMRAESGTYREGIFGGTTPEQRRQKAREEADELDESAILRRARGERVRVSKDEAAEVVTRMRRRGLSDNEIARRTRLKVERYVPTQRQLAAAS